MPTKPNIGMPVVQHSENTRVGGAELTLENMWAERAPDGLGVPYTLHNLPQVDALGNMTANAGALGGTLGPTGMFSRDGIYNGSLLYFTYDQLFFEANAFGANAAGAYAPVAGVTFETNNSRSTEMASIRQFMVWIELTTAVAMDNAGNTNIIANLPATMIDVASIGKQFYFIEEGTDTVYYTDLDTATHNPLNTFQGEVISDSNKSIYSHNNNLYIASSQTIEIHRPSGDFELPVSYTGTVFPFGAPSPAAWADTMGYCFTIGQDDTGARGIYKINGGTYEKISPHWLDRRLELLNGTFFPGGNFVIQPTSLDVSSIERCVGNAYTVEGHSVYELYIPGATAGNIDFPPLTISYDASNDTWFKNTYTTATNVDSVSTRPRFHGTRADSAVPIILENLDNVAGTLNPTDGRAGVFRRQATAYFDNLQQWRWCNFQGTERVFQVDDITQQMQITEAITNAGVTTIEPAPKANVNGALGGVVYDYSDNLGLDFQAQRALTTNFHAKTGHYVSNRRGGEVRQPGRIHRFGLFFAGNIEVGPMFINIGTLM